MSIRHKQKSKIDINELLIDLEDPSQENVEELNRLLGKYLDKVSVPLNLSFWQSVNFTNWSYVNLLKLTEKAYDTSSDNFVKTIYQIANENLRRSPKTRLATVTKEEEPDVPKEEKKADQRSWIPNITVPRPVQYAVGGVLALIVMGVTVKLVKDE